MPRVKSDVLKNNWSPADIKKMKSRVNVRYASKAPSRSCFVLVLLDSNMQKQYVNALCRLNEFPMGRRLYRQIDPSLQFGVNDTNRELEAFYEPNDKSIRVELKFFRKPISEKMVLLSHEITHHIHDKKIGRLVEQFQNPYHYFVAQCYDELGALYNQMKMAEQINKLDKENQVSDEYNLTIPNIIAEIKSNYLNEFVQYCRKYRKTNQRLELTFPDIVDSFYEKRYPGLKQYRSTLQGLLKEFFQKRYPVRSTRRVIKQRLQKNERQRE